MPWCSSTETRSGTSFKFLLLLSSSSPRIGASKHSLVPDVFSPWLVTLSTDRKQSSLPGADCGTLNRTIKPILSSIHSFPLHLPPLSCSSFDQQTNDKTRMRSRKPETPGCKFHLYYALSQSVVSHWAPMWFLPFIFHSLSPSLIPSFVSVFPVNHTHNQIVISPSFRRQKQYIACILFPLLFSRFYPPILHLVWRAHSLILSLST